VPPPYSESFVGKVGIHQTTRRQISQYGEVEITCCEKKKEKGKKEKKKKNTIAESRD
jgi:hypothetical protein